MFKKTLLLSMLLAIFAPWAAMAQEQQTCDPITIPDDGSWTEDFTLEKWPYYVESFPDHNYNLFSEYPENCWLVPDTIKASDGTISPRLWYNGDDKNRHISMKEGSRNTQQDLIVAFPAFSHPLYTLSIQFKSRLNMNGPRTLKIGYYDTQHGTFTELKSVSIAGTKDVTYGPYGLGNAPSDLDSDNCRLAFMLPANANGYSCDVKNITITYEHFTIPTQIASASDWNNFCHAVNKGHSYSGETVTLTADITTAVSTRAGNSSSNPFSGTFDGQGHTLNVNIPSSSNQGNAPFQYISGATIQNLVVNGTVTAGSGESNRHAAGLVGFAWSGTNTILNCRVNANVITSTDYTGGIIGHGKTSNIIMTGCAYTGEITATGANYVGGLVGWSDNLTGLAITDCFFAGTYSNTDVDAKFHPIGCSNHANQITATRTITNTYYTVDPSNMDDTSDKALVYGLDYKGKHAYSIIGVSPVNVAMSGSATHTYNWSGITAYSPGIVYNGTIYAGDGDNVNLTLTGAAIYAATSGSLTGTGSSYTLLMEASNSEIIGTECPMPINLTATTLSSSSAQISWEGNNTSYNLAYREANNQDWQIESDVPNPYTLNNLAPTTTYQVKVIGICGDDNIQESQTLEFTTPSTCPTPTNLSVTNMMATSATLNWEGEAESYIVRYRTARCEIIPFFEDFENPDNFLSTWTSVDKDNDDNNWQFADDPSEAHSGNIYAFSYGFDYEQYIPDNWLITPKVQLQGTLKFWVKARNSNYPEHYAVYVSTESNEVPRDSDKQNIGDFRLVGDEDRIISSTDYTEITVDLSSYGGVDGYIAIRHYNNDDMWQFYLDDFGIYATQEAGVWSNVNTATNSLDLTGLTHETAYEFQVKAVCDGNNQSEWTPNTTFTTPHGCTVPTELIADVTGNAAELSWSGTIDTYNIQYREYDPNVPATITLTVPDNIWQDGSGYQMLIDADATAYGTIIPVIGGEGSGSPNIYSYFEYKIPTDADGDLDTQNIVNGSSVSIEIPAGTYDWCITNPTPGDRIWIASANGNVGGRQNDYVFEAGKTYEFAITLLTDLGNDAVNVTITDYGSDWTLVEGVTNPYVLQNLKGQTTYQYRVQGANCDGEGGTTDWSESIHFTTGNGYTKHIDAHSEDGGWYLIASPLANAIDPANVTNMVTTEADIDLYRFNQSAELEWENWKQEGDHHHFDLESGKGYLYANTANVNLVFQGTLYSGTGEIPLVYNSDAELSGWNLIGNPFITTATLDMPFYQMNGARNALEANVENENIDAMEGVFVYAYDETNSQPIETATFTAVPSRGNAPQSILNISVLQSRGAEVDNAIIRFDEGRQLPKFYFMKQNANLSIPQGGEEYAIVSVGRDGACTVSTMPINFKANENGTYTLSFNTKNVDLDYLHLVDNLTGMDVDLLAANGGDATNRVNGGDATNRVNGGDAKHCVSTYTFTAKSTDYESRFELVFSADEDASEPSFAFINNGNIIVNGDGTLQIMDMMGRVIASYGGHTRCVSTNGMPAGLYVLRLIEGENVRTQKIVVGF